MSTTQQRGDVGVAQAISKFTDMGYSVALPISESRPYDLIVDDGTKLHRVQVKYFGGKGKPTFRMRRVHSNAQGYVVKVYEPTDFDWAYIYTATGKHYLLRSIPEGIKNTYTLRSTDEI